MVPQPVPTLQQTFDPSLAEQLPLAEQQYWGALQRPGFDGLGPQTRVMTPAELVSLQVSFSAQQFPPHKARPIGQDVPESLQTPVFAGPTSQV
jgi:hypothetical protein